MSHKKKGEVEERKKQPSGTMGKPEAAITFSIEKEETDEYLIAMYKHIRSKKKRVEQIDMIVQRAREEGFELDEEAEAKVSKRAGMIAELKGLKDAADIYMKNYKGREGEGMEVRGVALPVPAVVQAVPTPAPPTLPPAGPLIEHRGVETHRESDEEERGSTGHPRGPSLEDIRSEVISNVVDIALMNYYISQESRLESSPIAVSAYLSKSDIWSLEQMWESITTIPESPPATYNYAQKNATLLLTNLLTGEQDLVNKVSRITCNPLFHSTELIFRGSHAGGREESESDSDNNIEEAGEKKREEREESKDFNTVGGGANWGEYEDNEEEEEVGGDTEGANVSEPPHEPPATQAPSTHHHEGGSKSRGYEGKRYEGGRQGPPPKREEFEDAFTTVTKKGHKPRGRGGRGGERGPRRGGEHRGGEHRGGEHRGGEHRGGEHRGGEHRGGGARGPRGDRGGDRGERGRYKPRGARGERGGYRERGGEEGDWRKRAAAEQPVAAPETEIHSD